jgi:hypothetical protein
LAKTIVDFPIFSDDEEIRGRSLTRSDRSGAVIREPAVSIRNELRRRRSLPSTYISHLEKHKAELDILQAAILEHYEKSRKRLVEDINAEMDLKESSKHDDMRL